MLQQNGRVDLIEGQVGLADLCQLLVEPMAAPSNGEIGPGGQHQVNIGRKKIDEATQIRDEDGVREVMKVVKNDDHLGELCHLRLESFEQRRAESPSMQ